MKNNLNEEISRIKKLLNINENTLILEANPILTLIRKLAPSLEGKFISSVEAKLGGKKIAAASENEIKAAFKSAELAAIRKEIGDAIYTAEKSAIDAIFAKYNMSAAGESARAYSELSALNAGEFAGITKELGRSYRAAKGSTGAGAGTGTGAGAGTGSKPLTQSTPPPNTPSTGLNLNPNASIRQAMDASIAETAKKNPDALAYYAQIETFGFSDAVERAMKYQYSKIGNKPASELNIGDKIAQNPAKALENTGKTGLTGILYYTLIALAISASAIVLAYNTKIMNWFGMGGSNTNNSGSGQAKKGELN
jgi:hypothetical protein